MEWSVHLPCADGQNIRDPMGVCCSSSKKHQRSRIRPDERYLVRSTFMKDLEYLYHNDAKKLTNAVTSVHPRCGTHCSSESQPHA